MTLSESTKARFYLPMMALVLLTAALLGASVMVTPAEAQDPAGAIRSLSISSPDAGQMVITWDAPTETPADYRVRWAPSDQDCLSLLRRQHL